MSGQEDVPVACTRSGIVMTLEKAARPEEYARSAHEVRVRGVAARIVGRVCAGCRFQSSADDLSSDKSFCEYRPLRGPLFVPR